MSNRLFSTLEAKLAPNVPGCPLPVLVQYIREAAIDVCKTSQAWRFEQDGLSLVAGEYIYAYEVPTGAEVCGVIHSTINDVYASFINEEQLHANYPTWPATGVDDRAQPAVFSQLDVDHFVVAPVPDAVDTYTVKMFLALCPKQDATAMDKTVFDELEDVIVHGALYRLFSLPERSWTNADLASFHKKQSTYKHTVARAKANLTVGRSSLSVRMVPFGA